MAEDPVNDVTTRQTKADRMQPSGRESRSTTRAVKDLTCGQRTRSPLTSGAQGDRCPKPEDRAEQHRHFDQIMGDYSDIEKKGWNDGKKKRKCRQRHQERSH
jgi:hypothetical protein